MALARFTHTLTPPAKGKGGLAPNGNERQSGCQSARQHALQIHYIGCVCTLVYSGTLCSFHSFFVSPGNLDHGNELSHRNPLRLLLLGKFVSAPPGRPPPRASYSGRSGHGVGSSPCVSEDRMASWRTELDDWVNGGILAQIGTEWHTDWATWSPGHGFTLGARSVGVIQQQGAPENGLHCAHTHNGGPSTPGDLDAEGVLPKRGRSFRPVAPLVLRPRQGEPARRHAAPAETVPASLSRSHLATWPMVSPFWQVSRTP
jgi:hypothetical protein